MKKVILFILYRLSLLLCVHFPRLGLSSGLESGFIADYGLVNNFRVIFQIPQIPIMYGAGF